MKSMLLESCSQEYCKRFQTCTNRKNILSKRAHEATCRHYESRIPFSHLVRVRESFALPHVLQLHQEDKGLLAEVMSRHKTRYAAAWCLQCDNA